MKASGVPQAPAQRARATLLVLAAVALLVGVFLAFVPMARDQNWVSIPQFLNAVIIIGFGLVFGVLGILVRPDNRRPALIAAGFAVLAMGYLLFLIVAEVRNIKTMGDQTLPIALIVASIAALVMSIRWLWQAAAIARRIAHQRQLKQNALRPPGQKP